MFVLTKENGEKLKNLVTLIHEAVGPDVEIPGVYK